MHAADGVHRVGLLVTVPGHRPVEREWATLPVLELTPLTPGDAAGLLHDLTDGAVDPVVREELVTEAQGNPALLLALAHRLSPAQLRGDHALPRPLADAGTLTVVAGGCPIGQRPDRADLLLVVAAAMRATGERDAEAALVGRATNGLGGRDGDVPPEPSEPPQASELLAVPGGRLRFRSPLVGRAVYAGAPSERRRAAHRSLAAAHPAPHGVPALLHRSWTAPGPDAVLAAELEAAATDSTSGTPPALRLHGPGACRRADAGRRAAGAALHGRRGTGPPRRISARGPAAARRRREPAGAGAGTRPRRTPAGRVLLADGPVDDARESFLLAAGLLAGPGPVQDDTAVLGAADAAWAAGDRQGCLRALTHDAHDAHDAHDTHGASVQAAVAGEFDLRAAGANPTGLRRRRRNGRRPWAPRSTGAPPRRSPPFPRPPCSATTGTACAPCCWGGFDLAAAPLTRVVDRGRPATEPERLLRSAAAALMLGDVGAARRAGARALASARTLGTAALEPRALEYLAYAELRAGRHQLARTHAEEGLRAARRAGQRNTAAHHHAVLALAASIEGARARVTEHATAALTTARRHGLAQAALLAQWAAARADLGEGRPEEAADRLGPLVRPGARRGHFAVWMLAVPCFVEAAALAGRPEDARAVVEDFALWAGCGADPQAPAQLLRCRALLAAPEAADELYLRALDRHDETSGDFERARTELLHGKWLRRRRRLREARARLGEALVDFERCGAQLSWARQAAAELRAGGAAPSGPGAGVARRHGARDLSLLTPQQLRIARCVAEGATNREVALSLSVSTRTVDYHLRNVFATLGVRSRVELVRLVEQEEKTGAQL
ncbi:hypothetical protein SHIRM173S_08791 [Streptomyces hirsutus]